MNAYLAKLALGLDKAYGLSTGTPYLGADGKDNRAKLRARPVFRNISARRAAFMLEDSRLSSQRKNRLTA